MITSYRMDDKWFKAQQRKVGVTAEDIAAKRGMSRTNVSHILTGRQPMTLEWAKAFAETLQVDLGTILERAGVADPQQAQQINPGFSDSDAAPFVAGPASGAGNQARTVAELFGGGRPGVDIWQVKSAAMSLAGLLAGDYMLVDTHQAERTKPGDVVVAQVYSRAGATTVLRRFEPPVLVAASTDPADQRVHVIDGVNVVVRGKVVASWRQS